MWLPWLIVGVCAVYFGLLDGWRDATVGRFHRKALELFSDTKGITKVEVYLLKGEDANVRERRFLFAPMDRQLPFMEVLSCPGASLTSFWDIGAGRRRASGIRLCAMMRYMDIAFIEEGGWLVKRRSVGSAVIST
jgi:hypothetical protein